MERSAIRSSLIAPGFAALTRATRMPHMTASDSTASRTPSTNWLANQPYLLLSLTALFWAGNAIVGRIAAGHIPP